jgi:hypothetical protein
MMRETGRVGRLCLWAAAAAFFIGCGGSKAPPTPECSLNSDCAKFQPPGLICALGYCVKPCNISSDCPNSERCVIVGSATQDGGADAAPDASAGAATDGSTAIASVVGTACQAPEAVFCHYNSDCKLPLVCGIDQQCRDQCKTAQDCPMGQVCTANSHLCADPSVDKNYDPTTMDFRTVDGSASNTDGSGTGGTGGGSGGDGSTTAHDAAVDKPLTPPSCVAGLAGFHPSNLPASLAIPAGLPTVTQSVNTIFDTDTLTFNTAIAADGGAPVAMQVTLGDGRKAAVLFFQSYTLATGFTLTVRGEPPLIIAANDTIQINGTITTGQSPTNQWYGGGAAAPATNARGGLCALNNCAGGGGAGSATPALEMGSGGGAFCGKGGAGSIPNADAGVPAAGGLPYGTPELVPLVGGASSGSTNSIVGQSNHGGGALELLAGNVLTVDSVAVINMGGGADVSEYAVGGGSGGGILLEAPIVNLKGALTAAGASGAAYHGVGQNGPVSLAAAVGGSNGIGGAGSSATSINGGNGTVMGTADFGGGGGGAGRVRINTGCGGALNINTSSLVTPGSTTPCYTTGTLK